ncbi:Exonuclease [Corchorus olitorius]|uniref:Exonuclease n=1 Tax=Corchorus olitorius TaxID=93759 RepID=A0A1R3G442_9ROSI|nr:Exonuclease [Corchorus olitorius]
MDPTKSSDRSEICFFDLETTVPSRRGQGYAILEFGAILVCPKRLVELKSYSTLVRPDDLSSISIASERCNGITKADVAKAPFFSQVAEIIHDLLDGRIWAGHNIVRFDCVRIREAFGKIGRPPPEPKGTIDSLPLLTERSLEDVRMNLEVLKYCATVLFLESSLPDILTADSVVSSRPTTRSSSNSNSSPEGPNLNMHTPSSSMISENVPNLSPTDLENVEYHPIVTLLTRPSGEDVSNSDISDQAQPDPFDMSLLSNEIKTEVPESDVTMEEKSEPQSPEMFTTTPIAEGCSGYAEFLEPDEVSVTSISASLIPYYRGTQRIQLTHKDVVLDLSCSRLRVRFGVNTKFLDHAGRPRLNIMVDASPNLCNVLDTCDDVAKKIFQECGSSSEWRPVVIWSDGYIKYPRVRLNIPTVVNGDIALYATEIYQKDCSGTVQKLVFSKFDPEELGNLIKPGMFVDAFFSLGTYDYQQSAGIRLVAKKLIIHSDS